jgi:hypothetical protein
MFGDDYERLDKLCEQFTVEERRLGIFKVVLPSTAGEYFLMEERILTQHPQGKQGVSISKTKYDLVRDAIIESLQDKELTFVDLNEVVANKLADKFEGSISWYVTTVKLDLEAQKIIERVSKTTPQRLRLAVK